MLNIWEALYEKHQPFKGEQIILLVEKKIKMERKL